MLSLLSRFVKPAAPRPRLADEHVDDVRRCLERRAWDAPAAAANAGKRRRRAAFADASYIVLTTTGWLAGNLLGILGCAVAMFIVISHGHVDTFFLHLDNLASRYNAADLGRRATFEHQLVQVFVVVLALTLAVRGPIFVSRLRRALREGQGA